MMRMVEAGERARDGLRVSLAWLAHPVSVAGIALLLLNDHILKAEYGSWWTGKLSDAAGLMFAPALLAVVVTALGGQWVRSRRVAAVSLAVVGVGFVWVKATASGAATASAVWTAIAGPGLILHDATDLLALPALIIAWWAFTRAKPRPATTHARTLARARALILVPLATLAVAATSSNPSYDYAADVVIDGDTVIVSVRSFETYGENYGFKSWDPTKWYQHPVETLADFPEDWHATWQPWGADPTALEARGKSQRTEACVPSSPEVCYRTLPGRVAVEASDDGGATWSREWGLGRHQQARLDSDYEYSGWFGSDSVHAGNIGITETEDGYVVVAAMGPDGVAVRDASGAWIRVGMPGSGEAAPVISNSPGDALHLIAACLSMAVAAMLGALLVLARAIRPRKVRWYRYLVTGPTLAVMLGLLAAAWSSSLEDRYIEGGFLYYSLTSAMPPLVAMGLAVLAVAVGYPALALITPLKASRPKGVVLASLGVGLATGLSAALFLWIWVPLPFLAAVWVAATAWAVRRVRLIPGPSPESRA